LRWVCNASKHTILVVLSFPNIKVHVNKIHFVYFGCSIDLKILVNLKLMNSNIYMNDCLFNYDHKIKEHLFIFVLSVYLDLGRLNIERKSTTQRQQEEKLKV